jgi:BirA family transcriptional regulator, biotin operon repressor / biotin---[acetyl-CoA-carboxylase] ligase
MTMQRLLTRLAAGPVAAEQLRAALAIGDGELALQLQALRAAGIDVARDATGMLSLSMPVELLDREHILSALSNAAHRELAAITIDFDIASTQQRALAAGIPSAGCAVWLAERQTAGQGQRGRRWMTPLASGVALSVSRRFRRGLSQLSGLSLAVGASVADSVRGLGYSTVGVKWPNDLVAGDKKLGGILIGLGGAASGPSEVVIGLGLNRHLPADAGQHIDQPWCDLAMLRDAPPPSRNQLVSTILGDLLPTLARFDDDGLAPFLPRWRQLDALADRAVRVVDGASSRDGIARGVDERGALRVAHEEGERVYNSGDVSLRPA